MNIIETMIEGSTHQEDITIVRGKGGDICNSVNNKKNSKFE